MRRAGLVLMVTSIGLASLTSLMAKKEVDQYRAALSTERALSAQVVPTEEIYVSARPLRYGERLTLKDVRPVRWPSEAIPEGAFLVAQADLFPPEGPDYRNVLR